MTNEALLLIDIQDIYFTPGPLLLHKGDFLRTIKRE